MKYQITITFTTKLGTKSQTSTVVNGKKAATTQIQTTKQWLEKRGDTVTSTSTTPLN